MRMLADDGFACEASFTFADCALPPTIFVAVNVLAFTRAKSPLDVDIANDAPD